MYSLILKFLKCLPPFYFATVFHTTESDWITAGYALLIVLILAQELGYRQTPPGLVEVTFDQLLFKDLFFTLTLATITLLRIMLFFFLTAGIQKLNPIIIKLFPKMNPSIYILPPSLLMTPGFQSVSKTHAIFISKINLIITILVLIFPKRPKQSQKCF